MFTARTRNLLLLGSTAHVGGLERIVTAISAGLSQRCWSVQTVFPDWGDERFVGWCRSQGVEPEMSPILGKWGGLTTGLKTVANLSRFVRRCNAHVVNWHYSGGDISFKDVLAVRLAGVQR